MSPTLAKFKAAGTNMDKMKLGTPEWSEGFKVLSEAAKNLTSEDRDALAAEAGLPPGTRGKGGGVAPAKGKSATENVPQ